MKNLVSDEPIKPQPVETGTLVDSVLFGDHDSVEVGTLID